MKIFDYESCRNHFEKLVISETTLDLLMGMFVEMIGKGRLEVTLRSDCFYKRSCRDFAEFSRTITLLPFFKEV